MWKPIGSSGRTSQREDSSSGWRLTKSATSPQVPNAGALLDGVLEQDGRLHILGSCATNERLVREEPPRRNVDDRLEYDAYLRVRQATDARCGHRTRRKRVDRPV